MDNSERKAPMERALDADARRARRSRRRDKRLLRRPRPDDLGISPPRTSESSQTPDGSTFDPTRPPAHLGAGLASNANPIPRLIHGRPDSADGPNRPGADLG